MNKISLTGAIFFALSLTACGGGSGGSGNTSTNTDTANTTGTNGVIPVAALTTSNTQSFNLDNSTEQTITSESGYTGDIIATSDLTELSTIGESVYLTPGIPSMNITDVQRVLSVDFTCTSGKNAKATLNTDFSSGIEVITGSSNGQTLSCTSKYLSPLPTTITADMDSILDLLEGFGDDYGQSNASQSGLLDTNCPQDDSLDDDFDLDLTTNQCSGSFLSNYTITDDTDKIHKISQRISF